MLYKFLFVFWLIMWLFFGNATSSSSDIYLQIGSLIMNVLIISWDTWFCPKDCYAAFLNGGLPAELPRTVNFYCNCVNPPWNICLPRIVNAMAGQVCKINWLQFEMVFWNIVKRLLFQEEFLLFHSILPLPRSEDQAREVPLEQKKEFQVFLLAI